MSRHGPYSEEIYFHGGTKGPLESFGEVLFVVAFVEIISKCHLVFVVPWQQTDLMERLVVRSDPDSHSWVRSMGGRPYLAEEPGQGTCGVGAARES